MVDSAVLLQPKHACCIYDAYFVGIVPLALSIQPSKLEQNYDPGQFKALPWFERKCLNYYVWKEALDTIQFNSCVYWGACREYCLCCMVDDVKKNDVHWKSVALLLSYW